MPPRADLVLGWFFKNNSLILFIQNIKIKTFINK